MANCWSDYGHGNIEMYRHAKGKPWSIVIRPSRIFAAWRMTIEGTCSRPTVMDSAVPTTVHTLHICRRTVSSCSIRRFARPHIAQAIGSRSKGFNGTESIAFSTSIANSSAGRLPTTTHNISTGSSSREHILRGLDRSGFSVRSRTRTRPA